MLFKIELEAYAHGVAGQRPCQSTGRSSLCSTSAVGNQLRVRRNLCTCHHFRSLFLSLSHSLSLTLLASSFSQPWLRPPKSWWSLLLGFMRHLSLPPIDSLQTLWELPDDIAEGSGQLPPAGGTVVPGRSFKASAALP